MVFGRIENGTVFVHKAGVVEYRSQHAPIRVAESVYDQVHRPHVRYALDIGIFGVDTGMDMDVFRLTRDIGCCASLPALIDGRSIGYIPLVQIVRRRGQDGSEAAGDKSGRVATTAN